MCAISHAAFSVACLPSAVTYYPRRGGEHEYDMNQAVDWWSFLRQFRHRRSREPEPGNRLVCSLERAQYLWIFQKSMNVNDDMKNKKEIA
jgi:hypothetical protein